MPRRPLSHLPLLLVVALIALAACGRGGQTPTSEQPNEQPAASPLRVVYAEQRGGETLIWSASPDEPADRTRLARVEHDPSWGIRASLSPDGQSIAYTAMPPGARNPDRDAVLTVLDLNARSSRRVASGIDLRTSPVWSSDSGEVVALRVEGGRGSLVAFAPDGSGRAIAAAAPGHRLMPVAGLAGGAVIYLDWSDERSTLREADGSPEGRLRADLGPGPARGFALSPDGRQIAFLRLESADGESRYRAGVAALDTGQVSAVRPDVARAEDTGVAWGDGGRVIVSAVDAAGNHGVLLGAGGDDTSRGAGFDAIANASPDGRWLALRSFASGSPHQPGPETIELAGSDGRRIDLGVSGGVPIGWTRG